MPLTPPITRIPATRLQALLHRAAFAPTPEVGWLRITGPDRVRWLNGMTTNAIQTLTSGQGCYTFFLNPQGRIQADAYAFMQAESILLETGSAGSLATMLDRYIIMDDVELEVFAQSAGDLQHFADTPQAKAIPRRAGLTLIGPDAPGLLESLELPVPVVLTLGSTTWQNAAIDILQLDSPLVPTFQLWSDPATIGLLTETLRHHQAVEATPEALTQFRILSGIPLYGVDIRDKDLPQETSQTRALNFTKGCYIGQEIVERIHSRGNVHRTFCGFTLTGDTPPAGTTLTANDKPVGELTSIVTVGQQTIALGYIRREALETGATLTYPNGTAVASPLPFATALASEDKYFDQ